MTSSGMDYGDYLLHFEGYLFRLVYGFLSASAGLV